MGSYGVGFLRALELPDREIVRSEGEEAWQRLRVRAGARARVGVRVRVRVRIRVRVRVRVRVSAPCTSCAGSAARA